MIASWMCDSDDFNCACIQLSDISHSVQGAIIERYLIFIGRRSGRITKRPLQQL